MEPSNSSSNLETLPTEILRFITSYSPAASSLSLMRTSSLMHQKVEPLLYEHIEWNIERTYADRTIPLFCSKLLANPEIGLWVRSFTMIGRFDESPYGYDGIANSTMIALLQRASKRHRCLFDGYSDEQRQLFYSSSPIMLLSLLLFLCPNITALTPWSGYPEPSHRLTLLAHAISTLPHLKTITYGSGFSKFPRIAWKDESLNFIFSLPALRSLTLQVTEGIRYGVPSVLLLDRTLRPIEIEVARHQSPPCTLPLSPQITTFHLHSSVISCPTIGEFLARLPNIRDLRLHLLRDNRPRKTDTIAVGSFLDCAALASSLSQTSSTLERLVIICDFPNSWCTYSIRGGSDSPTTGGFFSCGRDGNPGTLRYWGTKDTLGDALRAFPKLRYLEVDPILLLGWDIKNHSSLRMVLPKDLSTLKLRVDFPRCEDWKGRVPWVQLLMEEFLEMEGGDGFEGLIYQVLESHVRQYANQLEEMKGMCEGKGVMFGVMKVLGY